MKLTRRNKALFIIIWLTLLINRLNADYPWPVLPLNETHVLTGTFCEYRDTGSSDHFHNAIDIPMADGSPVYPVVNGRVTSIESSGSNAYVRVERYCYLHIKPNPVLKIGDQVIKGETILGTILTGQAHIHFIDGLYNSEINPIRPGGVAPYVDSYPPIIESVQLFKDKTRTQFSQNKVSGLVDIMVHVREQNGPRSSAIGVRNNGTYLLGYQILSADRDSVVYSPPNQGLRFQFDSKPDNKYVHLVFSDWLATVSKHVYIVTNRATRDECWDTRGLPAGPYQIMIYTEDNRNNTDTLYAPVTVVEQDGTPPNPPQMKFVRQSPDGFEIAWYPNIEPDLAGYSFQYSYDNQGWNLKEKELSAETLQLDFFTKPTKALFTKVGAYDNAAITNYSRSSDVYGMQRQTAGEPKILIVDAFYPAGLNSAWPAISDDFGFNLGGTLQKLGYAFDMCSSLAVADSTINLLNYDAVFWYTGDGTKLFDAAEQAAVKQYLESGGKLFVSGTHIAGGLDIRSNRNATPADTLFLTGYLKARFSAGDSLAQSVQGVSGSIFESLTLNYAQLAYPVGDADGLLPVGGSVPGLIFTNSTVTAGVQYSGTFGAGSNAGQLIFSALPFETITDFELRHQFLSAVTDFFFGPTGVEESPVTLANIPLTFKLCQNYPNPFTMDNIRSGKLQQGTTIRFHLPLPDLVTITIFNLTGQKVATLTNTNFAAGKHAVAWDGRDSHRKPVANGLYIYRLQVGKFSAAKKLMIVN